MDRELGMKFARALSEMEGRDYIRAVVAFAAAPTIGGNKPSSLVSFGSGGAWPNTW